MNEDEARKFYETYSPGLKLQFDNYYKYTFAYQSEHYPIWVYATFGGDRDDIYRYSVDAKPFDAPAAFDDLLHRFEEVVIKDMRTDARWQSRE